MAVPTRIEGDCYINGALSARSMSVASGSVADANVAANAKIATSKLRHRHSQWHSQPNTAATTETRVVHHVYGAVGEAVSIYAGSIVANIGAATVTVDLKKNGASILTGVITLNNANTARVGVAGTISGGTLVVGDLLEIVITATAGGGTLATGVFVSVQIDEDAQ